MRYALPLALLLASCATKDSGVISTGPDTYMVSGRNTGVGATGHQVETDLLRVASRFCASSGKALQEVRADNVRPGFARFPSARVDFRCVNK